MPAFPSLAPLHVSYPPAQSDFALALLAPHRHPQLVTILLGADDVFLLETACAGDRTCIANGLPQVLPTVSANMATILDEIGGAGFRGVIVVVNYYSLDYSDPSETGITALLNRAVAAPAGTFGGVVADVFTALGSPRRIPWPAVTPAERDCSMPPPRTSSPATSTPVNRDNS